jgi:hypothetical protein
MQPCVCAAEYVLIDYVNAFVEETAAAAYAALEPICDMLRERNKKLIQQNTELESRLYREMARAEKAEKERCDLQRFDKEMCPGCGYADKGCTNCNYIGLTCFGNGSEADLLKRIERLRFLLNEYGFHDVSCEGNESDGRCTCGLDDGIKETE